MNIRNALAVALATALMTFLSQGTSAQEPSVRAMQWQVHSFREDAGLTNRIVHFMDFDPDGSVWLAATDGLYHFDGYDWKRFTAEDGLPSSYVRCVCLAQDGRLWVGTDQGVATFDGTRFDVGLTSGKLAGLSVRRIVQDPDGSLWFCCDHWPEHKVNAGLTRLKNGEFKTWRTADGLPSDYVSDYFRDSQGRQFVLTDRGLAQFTDDGFCLPWKDAGLANAEEYVWSVAESSRHGLVAATRSNFFHLRDGKWTQIPNEFRWLPRPQLLATRDGEIFTLSDGIRGRFFQWNDGSFVKYKETIGVSGGVDVLVEDPAGAIWACGFERILRWERTNPTWQHFKNLGVPHVFDQSGAVWFSDRNGVIQFHGQKWHRFHDLSGPVRETKDGRVWMSHAKGLAYWEQGKLTRLDSDIGTQNISISGEDQQGTIWATGLDLESGQPVIVHVEPNSDPARLAVISLEHILGNRTVESVIVDPTGGVCCIVSHKQLPPYGLIQIKNDGSTREIELPDRAQMNQAPSVHVSADGRVWVYGFFGAWTRDSGDGHWLMSETPTRLVDQMISVGSQTVSSGSGILGGTANLSRWNGSTWLPISSSEGQIVGQDKNEQFFVWSKESKLWTVHALTGAVTPPLTLPSDADVHNVVAGRSRERWIMLDKRTFRYRPSIEPPQTRIVRADDKLNPGDTLHLYARGVARFQPLQTEMDFFVSHRIDEGTWSPYEPLENEIEISGLGVGKHHIQVRVINENGIVDPTPAIVETEVLPVPLQERVGFQLALIAVFFTVVGLAIAATTSRARLRHLAQALKARVQEQTTALGKSERKYRELFEESADPICLFSADGKLRDQNKAAISFLDVEPGSAWAISDLFITASDERRFQHLLRNQGFLQGVRFQVKNRNNSKFEVLLSANTRSDVADGYQVIMRNITNLVQLEESLRSKQKMEVIGRMAGGISHDFNNFLGVMMQAADFMAATAGDQPEIQRGVNLIMKAAAKAKKLVGQISTFSRSPITGSRVIDTKSVLEEILLLLKTTIDESIQLSMNLPPDLGKIRANPEQLEQVVANLVVNACQAMPEGGNLLIEGINIEIDDATALDMNFEHSGSYVLLQFRDTGSGIPESVLEKIFDPFYTTKPHGQGSGLGLSIVSGIVRQSKGHVRMTSTPEQGSCFHIYLPRCNEPVDPDDKVDSLVVSRRGDESLLVVEDEPALRELTCDALQRSGYHVFSADNGLAATKILESVGASIDLVISDVAMPEMSGFELAKWIRARFPELPVLLVSGYPEPLTDIGQQLDTPFLSKPIRAAELTARIREILDRAPIASPRAL